MIRQILLGLIVSGMLGVTQGYAQEQTNTLTLSALFNRVTQQNPTLQAKKVAIQTALAMEKQAKTIPNPELELEAENIFGSGETSGFDAAETTFLLSETVERGGKRSARINTAKTLTKIAEIDYEMTKQQLFLTAFERYMAVISEGQKLSIAKNQKIRYKKFVETVKKQVKSGRLPQAEKERAEIQLLRSVFEIEKIEHAYTENLSKLSLLYNESGHFQPFLVEALPMSSHALKELDAHDHDFVNQNKHYQWVVMEQNLAKNQVKLARSQGRQDPVFSAGVKKDNGSRTTTYVAGIGMSLALFDQNKGSIESAKFRAKEWDSMRQAEKNILLVTYEHTFNSAHLLRKEAVLLSEKIIPKTKQVYEQVNQGYLQGKYAFLDVLNAQEDWIEAQETLVDVLGQYWITVAELEVILGHSLDHQLPQLFAQKETNDA